MKELRHLLDQQLRKLESEQELIDQAITEIHRRQGVLDEIASWNLIEEDNIESKPQEFESPVEEPAWAMSLNDKAW